MAKLLSAKICSSSLYEWNVMPRVNDPRTVTERVLAILGAFSSSRAELTHKEICQAAGLSHATAHRRLAELIAWGALEKSEKGKYSIGLRLWEVAALAPRGMPLREIALPYLRDLVIVTGGNSQLAVRSGQEALFVERLKGRNEIPAIARAANRLVMPLTAAGLVLLAHAPVEVQESVLDTPIPGITKHTLTDPTKLRSILADVRKQGYAISNEQLELGTYSVAAPVYDSDGAVVAALGLVLEKSKTRNGAIGGVVTSARSVSLLLGSDLSKHRAQIV